MEFTEIVSARQPFEFFKMCLSQINLKMTSQRLHFRVLITSSQRDKMINITHTLRKKNIRLAGLIEWVSSTIIQ